jgi:O-antigen/teichoic acid export membrane protein
MEDLKAKTIRGGIARILAQGVTLLVRVGSLMVLARLLGPEDFGLVGMVTAFTGVLSWFRDFGLSSATVQRTFVTEEQLSTLFWVNIAFGAVLALVTVAMAPAIAAFYNEPKLSAVTAVLATAFIFNSAGVQHSAFLQRQMRFTALAVISVTSLVIGTAIGIGGAIAGYGSWALVAMSVAQPFIATIGFWIATRWVPGIPNRRAGISSMLQFGGTLTLTCFVAYFAFNSDKIMVGRFWGAGAIGIYGRAFQLITIPIDIVGSSVGEVAFAALARLRDDPIRLKSYFLKGFSLVLGLSLPATIACAVFADDIVLFFLGPNWIDAATIVRLLSPTIAILAIINPLGWLINSMGLVTRSLKISLVFAPIMVAGCAIGLPYGPKGVALAYSAVMMLWVVPHIIWCVHGTSISLQEVLLTVSRPLASGILAGAISLAARLIFGEFFSPLFRLVLGSSVLLVTFYGLLLFAAGQKSLYLDLFTNLTRASLDEKKVHVPV